MTRTSDSSITIAPSIVSAMQITLQTPSAEALVLTNVLWNSELENEINPNLKPIVRLKAEISWDDFEQAESNQLFQLDPDLNAPIASQLSPDLPIMLTLLLQPERELTDFMASSLPNQTEDWILLEAWQGEGKQRIGYRTIWDYLDWRSLAEQSPDSLNEKAYEAHLLEAIAHFCRDQYTLNSQNSSEALDPEILDNFFKIIPNITTHPEATVPQLLDLMMNALQEKISTQLETEIPSIARGFRPSDRRTPRKRAKKITIPDNAAIDDPLTTMVKFCLHTEGWMFAPISNETNQTILQLNFQGQQGLLDCYIYVQNRQQQVIVYSILPIKTSQEARHRVAEFLMRLNYGLAIGNFEIDFEDGEIRYRTSANLSTVDYSIETIQQLIYNNLGMADQYQDKIQQVIDGLDPKQAIG